MHAHRCKGCGTMIVHGDEKFQDNEAHECPKCHGTEWEQAIAVRDPKQAQQDMTVQQMRWIASGVNQLATANIYLKGIFFLFAIGVTLYALSYILQRE